MFDIQKLKVYSSPDGRNKYICEGNLSLQQFPALVKGFEEGEYLN